MQITRTDRSRPWIPNGHGQRAQQREQQRRRSNSRAREEKKADQTGRQGPSCEASWHGRQALFPNPLEMARGGEDGGYKTWIKKPRGGETDRQDRHGQIARACDAHQIANPFLSLLLFFYLYFPLARLSSARSCWVGSTRFLPRLWLGDGMLCDDAPAVPVEPNCGTEVGIQCC